MGQTREFSHGGGCDGGQRRNVGLDVIVLVWTALYVVVMVTTRSSLSAVVDAFTRPLVYECRWRQLGVLLPSSSSVQSAAVSTVTRRDAWARSWRRLGRTTTSRLVTTNDESDDDDSSDDDATNRPRSSTRVGRRTRRKDADPTARLSVLAATAATAASTTSNTVPNAPTVAVTATSPPPTRDSSPIAMTVRDIRTLVNPTSGGASDTVVTTTDGGTMGRVPQTIVPQQSTPVTSRTMNDIEPIVNNDDDEELADDEEWEYYYDDEDNGTANSRVVDTPGGGNDMLAQLLKDAQQMAVDEKKAQSLRSAADGASLDAATDATASSRWGSFLAPAGKDGDSNSSFSLRNALSTVVTIDFFVVCGFLVWFVAGIAVRSMTGNDQVQIAFNNQFQTLVQPALGILMVGAAAGSFFSDDDETDERQQ